MKIINESQLPEDFFNCPNVDENISKEIVSEVRANGDNALRKYSKKFDDVDVENFKVTPEEIQSAYNQVEEETVAAIKLAGENIRKFALKQKEDCTEFEYEIQPGVITGQRIIPISRVGVYVPGGRYPLPSTVLMCAVPAKTAGVEKIVLCSPPTYNGTIHPAILVAADLAEVTEIYKVGGAQSIAAMAYGTETIAQVDKIVGPGNKYVTNAKKLVYGKVGIDFLAGPTEIMIIADNSANPVFVAADILAQAEHDTDAIPVLITNSEKLAEDVLAEVEKQLTSLATASVARESIAKNGKIIIVESIDNAIVMANKKAPEHLELQLKDCDKYSGSCRNYGTLFIGNYSAEALGDYSSGLNHTLPTSGAARYTGGLNVRDFLKFQTTLNVSRTGLSNIGDAAVNLGQIEGLDGHANSIIKRLESEN